MARAARESTPSENVARWWTDAFTGRRHEAVIPYLKMLDDEQSEVAQRNAQNGWRFQQMRLRGVNLEWETPYPENTQVSTNLIRSATNAIHALLGQNRPRITIQTDGADFSTQRKAKWLERYVEAKFVEMGVYEDVSEALRNAAVFGTGVLRVYEDCGKPQVESVLPDEFVVDERECARSDPRQVHHRRPVDVDVLCGLYPDAAEEIGNIPNTERMRRWSSFRSSDPYILQVIESWHLPSFPGAKDGRHTVCVEGVTLLDEPYTKDHFPFVFIFWSKPLTGFYGMGIGDEGGAIQDRVTQLDWSIACGQDHVARPRLFLKPGDEHLQEEIDNYAGGSSYVTNTGTDYKYSVSQGVGAEIYQHRLQLIREFYEQMGLSQATAQGTKPAGVESAVAIREVTNLQNGRYAIQAMNHEQAFIAIAKLVIALQKEIVERGDGSANDNVAKWKTRNLVKKIPWAKVDLDEDMYAMSVEAASILSRSPAGRMQAVIELAQANLLLPGTAGRMEARRLIGHPDLERSKDLATAGFEYAEWTIEMLLEEDEEAPIPDAHSNLALTYELVSMALLKAEMDRAPEHILERIRTWKRQAEYVMSLAAQAAAGGVPPANGNAPPAAAEPPVGAPMGGDVAGDNNRSPGGLGPAGMMLTPKAMALTPR